MDAIQNVDRSRVHDLAHHPANDPAHDPAHDLAHDLAHDRQHWHLVRLPTPQQLARRRGFPADRIDHKGMQAWCRRACRGGWQARPTDARGTVYRFERPDDAVAFALRWFPFKCG